MPHILIIGYGNPLRSDDGFGWHLAHCLQNQISDPDIEIIACHQLTPELAERIGHSHYVVFADASAEPMASELHLEKLSTSKSGSPDFSHYLDPKTLLAAALAFYGARPCAVFLLKAKAHELGYGEELSSQMTSSLERAYQRVLDLCEFLSSRAHPSPHPIVTRNV